MYTTVHKILIRESEIVKKVLLHIGQWSEEAHMRLGFKTLREIVTAGIKAFK
jgi:hypothetical protein